MSASSEKMSSFQWLILSVAWLVAVTASLSALFIGEVMGQMPCDLCWYQRIFMFPLVFILGLGVYSSDHRAIVYALPLAGSGLAIAAYHSLFYAGIVSPFIQPCRQNISCSGENMLIWGAIPLPFLSAGAFLFLSIMLTYLFMRGSR